LSERLTSFCEGRGFSVDVEKTTCTGAVFGGRSVLENAADIKIEAGGFIPYIGSELYQSGSFRVAASMLRDSGHMHSETQGIAQPFGLHGRWAALHIRDPRLFGALVPPLCSVRSVQH
jgi:hypothetical protein